MSLLRIQKPKTRKGRKALLDREPKVKEDVKNTLFIEGRKCSGHIKTAMKDLYHLKKPQVVVMQHNNDISPFEDASKIESLAQRNDCALFMFGSSSKKRPDNLILGRMYEQQLLDMFELGIKAYKGLADFKNDKIGTMVKPCLVFNGEKWKLTEELRRLRNLLIDTFHREDVDKIRLQGVEHVLSFTITDDMTVMMRSYKIQLKKSGTRVPRIELTEIGPSMDLSIRRAKIASKDLYKMALKKPPQLKVTPRKNVSKDELGNVHGRVHVGKQDINQLQTRKVKALKKTAEEKAEARSAKRRKVAAEKEEEADDINDGGEASDSNDE